MAMIELSTAKDGDGVPLPVQAPVANCDAEGVALIALSILLVTGHWRV